MSGYATYDLSESLKIVGINRQDIETIHYGWGYSPEGGGSWSGGFILELKSEKFATIEGWCDYTGWGCQDGSKVTYHESLPEAPAAFHSEEWSVPKNQLVEPDHLPADLNRWVRGEVADIDD